MTLIENTDNRTLESMLILEENYVLNISTLNRSYSSNKLKPEMRSKLATWMLEVCEEQQCTDEIYSLSINILDRLICSMSNRIEVYHLQLLGCVSLFLSSKLKSNQINKHFDAFKLIEYTDNSITLEDLLDWELLCLDKLRWDIAALVPNDFVDLFLEKLQQDLQQLDFNDMVKKHCYAFTAMCSTDFKFSQYPASMIASACILTAIKGLSGFDLQQISSCLAQLANIESDCLESMKEQIDDLFNQTTGSVSASNQQEQNNSIDEFNNLLNDFQFEDDYDLNIDYNLQLNSYELTRDVLNNLENKTPLNNNNNNIDNNKTLIRSGGCKKKKHTKRSKRLTSNNNNNIENDNVTTKTAIITPAKTKRNFSRTYSRRSSSGVSSCATNSSTNGDNLYLSNSLSSSSLASLLSISSQQNNNNKYAMSMLYVTPPQANSLPMPAFETEQQQQQRVSTRRKQNTNHLVIV
jgi:G1/S-specific cyclin-D2